MGDAHWRPMLPGDGGGGDNGAALDGGDWRAQLPPESRKRVFNKIMETLKRHLPVSGPEGLQGLNEIASRFEEKIYTAATSQEDYLKKIALRMLNMETRSAGNSGTNATEARLRSTRIHARRRRGRATSGEATSGSRNLRRGDAGVTQPQAKRRRGSTTSGEATQI